MTRANRPTADAIHSLDDRYDGILTRMALCGGWAALEQLERHLGDLAGRALVVEATQAGIARRSPLRSGAGHGLVLNLDSAWVLAGRDEFAVATRRAGIYAAIQRLEFNERVGRALYSPLWLGPELLAAGEASAPRLAALEEAILGLFRSPYIFFDFYPDSPAIAVIDMPFRPGDLGEGLAGLRTFVRHLGRAVPLWVLTDSAEQRARRVEWFAETPRVPDGVRVEVVDLRTAGFFDPDEVVSGARLDPADGPEPPRPPIAPTL